MDGRAMSNVVEMAIHLRLVKQCGANVRRIAELEKHLKQMLAYVDELEVDIGQEIRGVTYYEAKKALAGEADSARENT